MFVKCFIGVSTGDLFAVTELYCQKLTKFVHTHHGLLSSVKHL